MELYRSKQREWQNVQWTAQQGRARAKRFLEIVNFAWHIAKLFHHKKGNDEKFQTAINKLNEAVKQNADDIVTEHGQLMVLTR